MRTFLLKAKRFFKRNIYPITVSVCTVLVLGIITISAYTSIKGSEGDTVVVETSKETQKEYPDDSKDVDNIVQEGQDSETKPTVSAEPIIFGLPFENAVVSKEYTDSSLLYDATTKLWCTHQGIDFACEDGKKVFAVYGGKVEKIENSMMNGTVIYLRISDDLVVVYKGLSASVFVKEGDNVTKGMALGTITSFLAEKADGVHLHLELVKAGKLIDPTEYFSFNK